MKLKKGLSIFLILNQMCFLLLISQIILGQNFIIKVIDSSTSSPIPFASINYKNQKKGYSTNENGFFYQTVTEDLKNDSLVISCIGYISQSVNHVNYSTLNLISLVPSSTLLPEIIVNQPTSKTKKSPKGHFKGQIGGISGEQFKVGLTFDSTNYANKLIKSVLMYIPKGGNQWQPFRIRFYKLVNGKPTDTDIFFDNIIVNAYKIGWNTFPLLSHTIQIPPSGCLIAMEWLDFQNIDFTKIDYKKRDLNLNLQQYTGQYLGLGEYKNDLNPNLGFYQTIKTKQWLSSNLLFNNFNKAIFKNKVLKPLIAIEFN